MNSLNKIPSNQKALGEFAENLFRVKVEHADQDKRIKNKVSGLKTNAGNYEAHVYLSLNKLQWWFHNIGTMQNWVWVL